MEVEIHRLTSPDRLVAFSEGYGILIIIVCVDDVSFDVCVCDSSIWRGQRRPHLHNRPRGRRRLPSQLAEYDDAAVKVSEIPYMSDESCLDTFGRERVFWGSDFPNVSDVATYEESLAWLERVESLSSTDHEWIAGRAFRRFAGIG